MSIKDLLWDGYSDEQQDRLEWMAAMSQAYHEAQGRAVADGWSFKDIDDVTEKLLMEVKNENKS